VDRCLFGCSGTGESSYSMKTEECWKAARCLETNRVWESTGVYFSHGLMGCSDCMFCFNLKGKRNAIGNVQLGKEEYSKLKAKLISEMADELRRKKRLPGLAELIPSGIQKSKPVMLQKVPYKPDAVNPQPIQKAFDETCSIIFGKKLGSLGDFEGYLFRHVRRVIPAQSCLSSRHTYHFDMAYDMALAKTGRLISVQEQEELSGTRAWPAGIGPETLSFSEAHKLTEEIAYLCLQMDLQSRNMAECASVQESANGWRASRVYFCKDVAYSFWPRDADHVFGCDSVRNSSFLVNCYNSFKLSRCFEADTCQNCTGCYFCHNCENVHDSMFCFNAKNLRYAIGNC